MTARGALAQATSGLAGRRCERFRRVLCQAMLLDDHARYPLMFGPSPVHRLERLTRHLGGASVWAKRDDCNCGLAFGGNKIRKLEYLVADALAKGCDTLVSIGGVQSNHTRQVAAVSAHLGLGCVLVQESWEQALRDIEADGGTPGITREAR